MDEASLHIDAHAERIYDLVTDVTQMGRWSPECTGGKWLDGATGPKVGARFKGSNKHGPIRWSTKCEITKADPGKAFEFQVTESGMLWGYRFEPQDGGTLVTEYREKTREVNVAVRMVQRSGLLGKNREDLMVEGMRDTLARIKAAAES